MAPVVSDSCLASDHCPTLSLVSCFNGVSLWSLLATQCVCGGGGGVFYQEAGDLGIEFTLYGFSTQVGTGWHLNILRVLGQNVAVIGFSGPLMFTLI